MRLPALAQSLAIGILSLVLSVPGHAAATTGVTPASPESIGAAAFDGQVGKISKIANYGYLELNSWEGSEAATLKAQHPGLKVLMYEDMSSTRSYAVHNGTDDLRIP